MAEPKPANPLSDRGVAVRALPPFGRAILRCRDENVAAVSSRLGATLPREACRSLTSGSRHMLWLGPDEWLLLLAGASSAASLTAPLADSACSVVDISHRHVALSVEGDRSETLLGTGCPLDLAVAAFPVGACTRTVFHKAEIILWRTDIDRFHIELWRSFANYAEALLVEAEGEQF